MNCLSNKLYSETERDSSYYPPGPVKVHQYSWEFRKLLDIYESVGASRVLEIGSHEGGSLYFLARRAKPGAKILAVDNQHINKDQYNDWSRNIEYILGDSHDPLIKNAILSRGFFDFIFIDGDHSYNGVKEDWELAKKLWPKVVAFHDITPHPYREVDKLWREIQREGYITQEIIGDASWPDECGIGVVYL